MVVMGSPLSEVAVALKGTGETTCAEAPGVPMVTPAQAEPVPANKQKMNKKIMSDVWLDTFVSLDETGELLCVTKQTCVI
jgi:hypothetical protein